MRDDFVQILPAGTSQTYDKGNSTASDGALMPAPAGPSALPAQGRPAAQVTATGKAFYLETFGCQMNVHDSEKVAGVLIERGYRPVESYEKADLVLYNACSIREKAA